jgi:hypothetical protein
MSISLGKDSCLLGESFNSGVQYLVWKIFRLKLECIGEFYATDFHLILCLVITGQ